MQNQTRYVRLEIIAASGESIGATISAPGSLGGYVSDEALENLERKLKRHAATYVAAAHAADLRFPLAAILRDRDAPTVLLHLHADGSIHDSMESGSGISRCPNCGSLHLEDEGETVQVQDQSGWGRHGRLWCSACVEDHTYRCEDCGDYYPLGDSVETADGNTICPICEENYYRCEDCGELYLSEDLRTVDGSELICQTCLADGEGDTYHYHHGEGWSTTPQEDDEEDDDDEHLGGTAMKRHPYHTNANTILQHSIPNTGHTFGAELEFKGRPNDWGRVTAACSSRAILTDDATVSGELVTAALTAGQIRRWLAAIAPALAGTRNDRETGFHIHVDRRALSPWQWFELTHYAKEHSSTLEAIGGRGSNRYHDLQRLPAPTWPSFASNWTRRAWPSRYTGVNLNKGPTVEFRFNRATKTKARALARFALIQRLVALGRLTASQRPQTAAELRGWLAQDVNIREVTGWNVGDFNYREAMKKAPVVSDQPPAALSDSELEAIRQKLSHVEADRSLCERLEGNARRQEWRVDQPGWRRDCRARELHYYRQRQALADVAHQLREEIASQEVLRQLSR